MVMYDNFNYYTIRLFGKRWSQWIFSTLDVPIIGESQYSVLGNGEFSPTDPAAGSGGGAL